MPHKKNADQLPIDAQIKTPMAKKKTTQPTTIPKHTPRCLQSEVRATGMSLEQLELPTPRARESRDAANIGLDKLPGTMNMMSEKLIRRTRKKATYIDSLVDDASEPDTRSVAAMSRDFRPRKEDAEEYMEKSEKYKQPKKYKEKPSRAAAAKKSMEAQAMSEDDSDGVESWDAEPTVPQVLKMSTTQLRKARSWGFLPGSNAKDALDTDTDTNIGNSES